MDKPFFVMLYNQKGDRLVPMVDPDNELYMYATYDEARTAAKHTLYGDKFGYEVFAEGDGRY
jgi:hypothetical protein